MAIKSALMTTAGDVLDGPNTHPLVIFRQGAGHVQPNNAADPGLVFDSDFNDWLGFLCGTRRSSTATCTALGIRSSLNASDFNVASIAIGDLAGSQTVTRRVTNVDGGYATYTAVGHRHGRLHGQRVAVIADAGARADQVVPGHLHAHVRRDECVRRRPVDLDRRHVEEGARPAHRAVPMVIKPVALSAPAQVSGTYTVKFGFTGPFTAAARGLVPAATTAGSVATDGCGRHAWSTSRPAARTRASRCSMPT